MKNKWMQLALLEANKALEKKEVPIGAVIVQDEQVIAKSHNQTITENNPCAHAEILCIQDACSIVNNHRLTNCSLYVTLEPCIMCYGAIIQSRIPNVYYGAYDQRTGIFSTDSLSTHLNLNHHPKHQGGILEHDCQQILTLFFQERR